MSDSQSKNQIDRLDLPNSASSLVAQPVGSEVFQTTLIVNGVPHTLNISPDVTLLDALRERLGMCGTKKGCDQGLCGACTVLIEGKRYVSCLRLAVMHDGDRIETIEGLAADGNLHPVQEAFIRHDAFQCGYCTPGQIMSAIALLDERQAKTDLEIAISMTGNICRCGAYANIVAAIREVVDERQHEEKAMPGESERLAAKGVPTP